MLNQITRKGKKIIAAIATAAILTGSAQPALAQSPKTADKPLEVKVEETFKLDEEPNHRRLRTTLTDAGWLFRYDNNESSQDQWLVIDKLLDGKNTKFSLIAAGDIAKDGKAPTYAVGASLSHSVGKMPLLGNSTIRVSELHSFVQGDYPLQKTVAGINTEHVDIAYQFKLNRDRKPQHQYYVGVHGDSFYGTLGWNKDRKVQGLFLAKNNPNLGLFAFGNYDPKTGRVAFSSFNAFKGADAKVHSDATARLVSDLMVLGTMDVNFPYLTGFLTDGTVTHRIDVDIQTLKDGTTSFEMANQLGVVVTKNWAVGGGVNIKMINGKPTYTPVVSTSLRIPAGKDRTIYFEGEYKNGNASCYASTTMRF